MWTRTIHFAWVVGIGSIITIIVFIYIFFTKLKLTKELKPQCEEDAPFVNQSADLIDKTGIALTDIRPIGKANIEDNIIEVISVNNLIKKNTPVRVVKVEGSKVFVEGFEGLW